jgi:translation initiation factor 2B subunit (eIF-2B alpha/beta/delta family)
MTMGVSSLLGEVSKEVENKSKLERICMEVIKKGPIMAPLVNLVNGALLAIEEGKPLADHCLSYSRGLEDNLKKTARHGASMIRDRMKVLTYSNSSTILETLGEAAKEGREFEVMISDAGPIGEGIMMAESISDLGVQVVLVPDGSLFQEMEDIDIVMVGADSITTTGLINKIGTRGLAAQARLLGKEMVSLASSEKVLPPGIDIFVKKPRDPSEVYKGTRSLKVRNYYFDRTPLHLLSKILTEKGPLSPFEIMTASREKRIHGSISEYFRKIK